jgi:hypothetical protein
LWNRKTGKIRLEKGKYRKVYDRPKRPCERLLELGDIGEEVKEELKRRAGLYNPVKLKIFLDKARNRLLQLNREKARVEETSCQEVSARKIIRQCAPLLCLPCFYTI